MLSIFNWTYVPRSFLTTWCLRKEKIKRNREEYFDSLHKSKYWKVKDRPFAEGSRGCHVLICLYAQHLSAKECHVILPLMIAIVIMQFVAFIILPSQIRTMLNFLLHQMIQHIWSNFYCLIAPMTTYLKDLTQSLGTYGGLLKIRFGFKGLWMQK